MTDAAHNNSGDAAARMLAPVPDAWEYWDGTPLPKAGALRWGYTTGACVTAALAASWCARTSPSFDSTGSISLLFGDGRVRTLPLSPPLPAFPGYCVIRKNAGDDPDCTHGMLVACRLRPLADAAPPDERDVLCQAGEADIWLHNVCGVGCVTLDGLDCARGHWAINPGVVRMLSANLTRLGLVRGSWAGDIAIPEGTALAAKTLNAGLGVLGGLSLLGTTGLVRPFSHDAYVASVCLALRCAAAQAETAVLCTGTRTRRAARDWCALPGHAELFGTLAEESFVSIADFLGDSLRAARRASLKRVLVCCMPGKLLKYAAGFDNTHAHKVTQAMGLLADISASLFPHRADLAGLIASQPSMRAALAFFSEKEQDLLFSRLAALALRNFALLCSASDASDASGVSYSSGAADGAGAPGADVPAFAILLTDTAGTVLHFFPDQHFCSGQKSRS